MLGGERRIRGYGTNVGGPAHGVVGTGRKAEVPRRPGGGVIINTFGISPFAVRRGGTVVTCGSSTGYDHHDDNPYLRTNLKRIAGSHAANLQGQAECKSVKRLDCSSRTSTQERPARSAWPREGPGVTDPEMRPRIGAARLNPLRNTEGNAAGAPSAVLEGVV
jgi:crotonyl-CoA reductase